MKSMKTAASISGSREAPLTRSATQRRTAPRRHESPATGEVEAVADLVEAAVVDEDLGGGGVLHLGVLYHLEPTHESLRRACQATNHLVLETEVCDLASPDAVLMADEEGYDQAVDGRGCRPSAARVERILAEEGLRWQRVTDDRCNADMHVYDWPETNSGRVAHGQRRFWFAERP